MTEKNISIIEMHCEKTEGGILLWGVGATTKSIIRWAVHMHKPSTNPSISV